MAKENWRTLHEKMNEYDKARYSFVMLCMRYRLPYEQIGELIGITKARVYQLQRYGKTGIGGKYKEEIRKRDGNRCLICRYESKRKGDLHVHHIGNSRNHKKSNLITLCASCHTKTDAVKRRNATNLTKV